MGPAKKNRALVNELDGSHFDLLTGRDRFSCCGPGTGTNYEKRLNGTRNSVWKFQPGKQKKAFFVLLKEVRVFISIHSTFHKIDS